MAERDDDAELLRLYTDLEAAIKKAIGAAPDAPKPLQGDALQRPENPNEPAAKCQLARA